MYAIGGFLVTIILMEQEFDKVKEELVKLNINNTSARENIGGGEWPRVVGGYAGTETWDAQVVRWTCVVSMAEIRRYGMAR